MNEEKLGYRDLHYSHRHRKYGNLMTWYDIDAIEYDATTTLPVSVIELKHGNIREIDFLDHEFRCIRSTANALEKCYDTPFFTVVYYYFNSCGNLVDGDQDEKFIIHHQYYVIPLNKAASSLVAEPTMLSERNYIRLLYLMRKTTPPELNQFSKDKKVINIPKLINYEVK